MALHFFTIKVTLFHILNHCIFGYSFLDQNMDKLHGSLVNGKSPTFAKRFRQLLEQILPEETDDLLTQLKIIRDQLKGNFEEKVKALNEVTKSLVKVKKSPSKSSLLN